MKYKLEITQEQADIISKACDLYCRLRLGQFANSILPYDIETTKQINIEEY